MESYRALRNWRGDVRQQRVSDQTLAVGTRLDDYQITAVLGEGGFGITYKAVDESLRRAVAIKEYLPRQFAVRDETATVRPRSADDEGVFKWGLTRFIEEARALALFKHPNIVAVIRYLEANGTAYLVMEYEEGCDLERWIAGRTEPVVEAVLLNRIVLPLLEGLSKVHEKGLLHRDIKPANVFMRRDDSPVLIDFGSSRAQATGQSSNLTSIISAGYSPFEQYGGAQKQGPWSDLYAFAGTLYRVVTGKAPTDAIERQQGVVQPAAEELAAGRYSVTLLRAIDQALALDPAQRPQSAQEFRQLLVSESATIIVTPLTIPEADPSRARRGWLGLLVAGVLVLGIAGVILLRAPQTDSPVPVATPPQVVVRPATTPSVQTAPPVPERPESNAAPAEDKAVDEDAILAGWTIPADVASYRANQITGALLAYTSNKEKFDACMAAACADQARLMDKITEALQGYEWSRAAYSGSIRLENPRRLSGAQCPFLIDVVEVLRSGAAARTQQRSYCTADGFNRHIEHAGPVSDTPIVEAAGEP